MPWEEHFTLYLAMSWRMLLGQRYRSHTAP